MILQIFVNMRDDLTAAFENGIKGRNKGLPTGIPKLNRAIHGVQRGAIIGVAGSPKSGKSTLADSAFLINPYMHMLENPEVDIDFFYWSLEMNKVDVRFRSISHFFARDYGITSVDIPNGKTYKGSTIMMMNSSYLLGKLENDDNEPIVPSEEHQRLFKEILEKRINPMFGTYDDKGKRVTEGKVTIIEDKNDSNPTGVFNYLMNYAKKNGTFLYEEYETTDGAGKKIIKHRVSGYRPNNPDKYIIIITDHMRALKRERQYTLKQNMDKMGEYQIILRNLCNFTFIDIIHLNRNISDITRIKFNNEFLFPNNDDIKDSGNIAEDCDYLLTMFDATDDRYGIKKHFGMDIEDIINYRSIHLVSSRHSESPAHIQTRMYAGISRFEEL
jgi:hypothetical protein